MALQQFLRPGLVLRGAPHARLAASPRSQTKGLDLAGSPGRRRAALSIVVGLAAALSACSAHEAPTADGVALDNLSSASLKVESKVSLPIAEVSGLGRRRLFGAPSYLAVGDGEATVITFAISAGGAVSDVEAHDVSPLFGPGSPQWEAVAGDGTGRVFVLSEPGDRVTVIDRDLGFVEHEIALSLEGSPLANEWAKDPNSRGEGMALLANGHLLIVKEKDPVVLVEFGPPEDFPEGYAPALALGERAFALPAGGASEFVPLHHWTLKDGDQKRVPDVSELAFDAAGGLLLLTDQGRAVVSIERVLDPFEDRLDLKGIFTLPSSVDKPEGLVLSEGGPFVASDRPSPGKSLFRVSSLP